jgi:acetyltransferase-like isoleucine patch superfamily enzyme
MVRSAGGGFIGHWYDTYCAAKRSLLRRLLQRRFGAFGRGSTFDPTTSTITGYHRLFVGRDVFIGRHAIISASTRVVIGDDTVIGAGFCLMPADHDTRTAGRLYAESPEGPGAAVTIGRNVWIGANVTVLKGVTIGDAAVVGAGSVVTRDIAPFGIAVGVPARVIRERFVGEQRRLHERRLEDLGMPA